MNEIINVTNKTPIEIALQIDENGMTTARKLFDWLKDEKNYSRWLEKNITDNPFAEGEYFTIPSKTSDKGGRPMENYKITSSLAKKISMMSKTEEGNQARQYFIGCEQCLQRLAESNRRTELERAKGIAIRQALTSVIDRMDENTRQYGHAYSNYTNLIYRLLFNKTAKQILEEKGITDRKAIARDYLTADELIEVQDKEMLVNGLLASGWGYEQIKEFMMKIINRPGTCIETRAVNV